VEIYNFLISKIPGDSAAVAVAVCVAAGVTISAKSSSELPALGQVYWKRRIRKLRTCFARAHLRPTISRSLPLAPHSSLSLSRASKWSWYRAANFGYYFDWEKAVKILHTLVVCLPADFVIAIIV